MSTTFSALRSEAARHAMNGRNAKAQGSYRVAADQFRLASEVWNLAANEADALPSRLACRNRATACAILADDAAERAAEALAAETLSAPVGPAYPMTADMLDGMAALHIVATLGGVQHPRAIRVANDVIARLGEAFNVPRDTVVEAQIAFARRVPR